MTKKVKDVADVIRTFEVDGINYEEIDKEVEVGDLIAITARNNNEVGAYYDVGHVGCVKSVDEEGDLYVDFNAFGNGFVDGNGRWYVGDGTEGDYTVVKKISPSTLTEMPKVGDQYELVAKAESPSPKTDRDLIVELSQTVAKLKREAELNDDFIAETLTRIDDAIERLTDDVVMLDERTQPLVEDGISDFAKELAEMIERKINESRAEGRI